MKITRTKKESRFLFFTVLTLLFELWGFSLDVHPEMFIYYTNLSNLIALLSCLLTLGTHFFFPEGSFARFASLLRYVATCMTTVTMLVVVCVLVPMQGIKMLYQGNFFCFHLVCPALMLSSFLSCKETLFSKKQAYIGTLPTLLYGTAALVANCLGILNGPYPFLMVRNQPVYVSVFWCVAVFGIAYGVAAFLLQMQRKS